jgi:hypothetical protein
VKLLVVLNSENNNTCLAPILGQYMIKPLDFVERVKKINKFDHDKINSSLLVAVSLEVGKNNVYKVIPRA